MNRNRKLAALSAAVMVCVSLSMTGTAQALTTDDPSYVSKVQEMAQAMNLPETTIDEQIAQESAASGRTSLEVANEAYDSMMASVIPSKASISPQSLQMALPTAQFRGDFFISNNSTMGINHGHTGIYVFVNEIVEAPGPGQKSHKVTTGKTVASGGAVLYSVMTAQTNRNKAAARANNNYIGRGYNINFITSNKHESGDMNCSQLVWAAYDFSVGIDLDGNGGSYVWPYDLRQSPLVSSYRIVQA